MSHDFAFWESDEALENEEAGDIYGALVTTGTSTGCRPSAKIALLATEIAARWPVPPSGCEDEWALTALPTVSDTHLIVCLVPSRLWDVWPVIGKFATEQELTMYDPQQQQVFLPPRLSRKRTRIRAKKRKTDA